MRWTVHCRDSKVGGERCWLGVIFAKSFPKRRGCDPLYPPVGIIENHLLTVIRCVTIIGKFVAIKAAAQVCVKIVYNHSSEDLTALDRYRNVKGEF
jgi:hypothetical protein